MLIATFVRCLSYLLKSYISFTCLHYHIFHGQNARTLLDKDKLLRADNLCKAHKFSYQIYDLQIEEDLKDIFGIRIVKLVHLGWKFSIWIYH